jgi:hypothetical protein
MNFIAGVFHILGKIIWSAIVIVVCASMIFIHYKANQPMALPEAPKGMTYSQFIQDRIEAAKVVQPSRCGWGMFLALAVFGPIYSVIYTDVAVDPDGFLAKRTAPDPDIPKGVAGARWSEIPEIWWGVVERLSWTMMGRPSRFGCQFRSVNSDSSGARKYRQTTQRFVSPYAALATALSVT